MRLAFAFSLFAAAAQAGSPTDETVTCPLGGEAFTITSTLSCSVLGRYLTLRPITSCDFITRMPVCPSNGLPVFGPFSDAELQQLDAILAGPDWPEIAELDPFQRSYALALRLDGRDPGERFGLLLSAFWYETDSLLARPEMFEAFLAEGSVELSAVPASDQP